MFKQYLLFFSVFVLHLTYAQELCGTHKILREKLKNEAFQQSFQNTREILKNHLEALKLQGKTRGTIYTISVVFHVLHDGGEENISRAQVINALEILNRDYRRLNQDANNVAPVFQGLPADIEVEFKLATKAPNGSCFNGITRTQSPMSFNEDGWNQVQAIIDGNDVYNDEWPGDQYLNFFICGAIGFGAAGYTYLPGSIGSSMYNGIWLLHNYVGAIGTSDVGRSRVLTHEVGHWLDLPHTWGYTNDPGLPENCDSDDGIEDTPNTVGVTFCDLDQNACGPIANVENYMDYSYCSKMFTEGQKERMRSTLTSFVDGRNNLITPQNIAATGADDNFYLCEAKFTQDLSTICTGENINFTDLSFNKATSWSWYFEGGTPAVSSSQNPTVTYNSSGKFNVKLIVSDGITSDSIEQIDLITVLNESMTLPFYEDFEDVNMLNETSGWIVENPQNNQTYTVSSFTAHSGVKSIFINNFDQFGNSTDDLVSYPIDLSNVDTMVTLSFRYAYKRRPDFDNERLQVFSSIDCGRTWTLRKSISGLLLSQDETSENYIPTSDNEWQLAHVTSILESNWIDNFRFKLHFVSEGGNNVYIDDINIYEGPPSETVFSQNGLMDAKTEKNHLVVFPNPTMGDFTVRFPNQTNNDFTVLLLNQLGQSVYTQENVSLTSSNELEIKNTGLKAGVYTLKIIQKETVLLKKLTIQ